MHFHLLLQRSEGRMRPRWQMGGVRGIFGELRVADEMDDILKRRTTVAHFLDIASPMKDLVPPLKDVRLLYVDYARIVLCGFEQLNERDYAQTWMLATQEDALHAMS